MRCASSGIPERRAIDGDEAASPGRGLFFYSTRNDPAGYQRASGSGIRDLTLLACYILDNH